MLRLTSSELALLSQSLTIPPEDKGRWETDRDASEGEDGVAPSVAEGCVPVERVSKRI